MSCDADSGHWLQLALWRKIDPTIVLGGDFNLPGITWDDGLGQVNPNPAYGFEVNNLLIDILKDTHLEQLVTQATRGYNFIDFLFFTCPAFITNV